MTTFSKKTIPVVWNIEKLMVVLVPPIHLYTPSNYICIKHSLA